jgi:hypothetical protein
MAAAATTPEAGAVSEDDKKRQALRKSADDAGCELTQLGNTEVFYCPTHTGMAASGAPRKGSSDAEINDMVSAQMGV